MIIIDVYLLIIIDDYYIIDVWIVKKSDSLEETVEIMWI